MSGLLIVRIEPVATTGAGKGSHRHRSFHNSYQEWLAAGDCKLDHKNLAKWL
jgi:hypothetical protein